MIDHLTYKKWLVSGDVIDAELQHSFDVRSVVYSPGIDAHIVFTCLLLPVLVDYIDCVVVVHSIDALGSKLVWAQA